MSALQNSSSTAFARATAKERDYWLDKLSHGLLISSLPARFPGADDVNPGAGKVEIVLESEVQQKLDKLTAGKPFLLYAVLMATLKVCLYKYTGNNRIIVGSPARRTALDAPEPANALAIVDEINGRLTFKQLLLNVRQTLLEAYARQNYSFNLLLTELALPRVEKRCPLFDVALMLKDLHTDLPEVGNRINITFTKEAEQVKGIVSYDGAGYEPVTLERFGKHFVNVLKNALNNSDLPISAINMLDEAEQRRLTKEWQGEDRSCENFSCVHQLFEAQVVRTPNAVALVFENETLSYAELNNRANKLAHYLQRMGVEQESRVAVFMDRSINSIESIFAIMKAGGTYVLLDPAYPHQRLKYMLENSRAILVLTAGGMTELPFESNARVVNVDGEWSEIEQESTAPIESGVSGGNLAYVIYTSGSTGQPKGVLVTHSALVNFTLCAAHHFGLDSSDRLLQFLSPSFDAFGEELYPTLCSGATLVMHLHPTELSPHALLDFCEQHGVTALHIPPVYINQMLKEMAQSGRRLPEQIKLLITGGESVTSETVRQFREAGGERARILHVYGPSETTVTATLWEAGEGEVGGRVAIGRPLWNVQVYVVDQDEELVPVGATGELYIGGAGVARGYEREAAQTAERFAPDRWSGVAGGRVYRTGDLVRYRVGGELEFVGRRDEQVKVHGHRIELGEIEVALGELEGVRDAVVLLREDVPNEKRLVAYVMPAGESAIDVRDLRERLRKRLPDYILPSAYVVVKKWPTTQNSKVDKRALPPPGERRELLDRLYVAPSTPTEEKLAAIWKELLKVEPVGIHDDFLESGGNSLTAFQLVSRIRDVFHIDLPLSSVFETPTIAEQATAIAHRMVQHESPVDVEKVLTQIEQLDGEELERLLQQSRPK